MNTPYQSELLRRLIEMAERMKTKIDMEPSE